MVFPIEANKYKNKTYNDIKEAWNKIKAKLDKAVADMTSVKERIQSLKLQAQWELDGRDEEKAIEALEHLGEYWKKKVNEGSYEERFINLQTNAWFYTKRKNSDVGKNQIWKEERDLVWNNFDTLIKGYDEAKPEKVEKWVRSVRPRKSNLIKPRGSRWRTFWPSDQGV